MVLVRWCPDAISSAALRDISVTSVVDHSCGNNRREESEVFAETQRRTT
jgi:hypothetical protein